MLKDTVLKYENGVVKKKRILESTRGCRVKKVKVKGKIYLGLKISTSYTSV